MRFSLILRAVTTSWVAVLANAAAGLLLTPYVLHHIGDEAFGLWVLVVTLVGYYGVLDGGVRSSILRYTSRYRALGDQESVKEVVATAFYYYLGACALVILVTYLSVGLTSRFFAVHSQVLGAFKSLFLLAGVVQGLSLPLAVFSASLEAAGRYDQVYVIRVASLAVRVVAVIAVVRAGGGLFGVGAAVLLSQLLSYIVQVPLAMRANQGLSLRPKWVRKSAFQSMLRYGSISLTVCIAEKLRSSIYPVVIAKFLTPVAVTFFSLPVRILSLPTEGIGTMTEIVNPVSSELEARNDFAKLRELILLSVQSAFLLLAPMAAFLFIFGRELLTLWVGTTYASTYSLLVLLTLGMGTAATQCCLQSMLFGIEKHKQLIWYRMGEGLSIALLGSAALRIAGLEGFAVVITLTLLLTSLILVPRHLCHIVGLPLRTYLTEGCLKPCIAALPGAAAFMALRGLLVVDTWPTLFFALFVGSLVYILTLFVMLCGPPALFGWFVPGILHVFEQRFLRPRGFRLGAATETVYSGESQ
jgi:O-antigen/teichoic acid export membrane protein